eukprot:207669-Rhodomonas_salina.3
MQRRAGCGCGGSMRRHPQFLNAAGCSASFATAGMFGPWPAETPSLQHLEHSTFSTPAHCQNPLHT